MTRKRTAVESSAETVQQARATMSRWEAERTAAEAELESLQSRVGGEVLDTPDAAPALAGQLQVLRDRISIATSAVEAARPRAVAAERDYLLAEADALRPVVSKLKAKLAEHESRTDKLLAELEQHEGPYVPQELLEEARATVSFAPRREIVVPRSNLIREEISKAELPLIVLTEMAAGNDPQQHPSVAECTPAESYPACVWGPDALVKAPAYLRTVTNRREALTALEDETIPALERNVEQKRGEVSAALEAGNENELRRAKLGYPATAADRLAVAEERLAQTRHQAARDRAEFEALTESR